MAVGPGGRFVLLDKLGEGGMGEVWLANDRELSQAGEPAFVALKFLSSAIKDDLRMVFSIKEITCFQVAVALIVIRANGFNFCREMYFCSSYIITIGLGSRVE